MIIANGIGSYNYKKSVCHVNLSANYVKLYLNVSLTTCQIICNQVISDKCSGIFWNRVNGSCWLTSQTDGDVKETDCETLRKEVVFFRRIRSPSKSYKCITKFKGHVIKILYYKPTLKSDILYSQVRCLLGLF